MTSEGPCLCWEPSREPSPLWWGRPEASPDPQPTKSADLASGCKPPLALCNPRWFPQVSPGWGQRERWGDPRQLLSGLGRMLRNATWLGSSLGWGRGSLPGGHSPGCGMEAP